MSTFNAGSIKADLTLGRSGWSKDLRKTKQEIRDLEKTAISIMIDADIDNALVGMDNVELFAENLDGKKYTFSVDADIRRVERDLEQLSDELERLDRRLVGVSVYGDTDNARIALDNLENDVDVLENDPATITVNVDLADANAALTVLEERIDRLDGRVVNVNADADVADAMAELELLELQAQLLSTETVRIDTEVDTSDTIGELAALEALLAGMSAETVDVNADVDTAVATAQLAALQTQLDLMDGRTIDIDVDVDQDRLQSLVGGGGGGGSLGLLRILIYAIILLSPILAVAISGATAAVLGFLGAIAGALIPVAVLAAGMTGLIQRFKEAEEAGGALSAPMQALRDALDDLSSAWEGFLDQIEVAGFDLAATSVGVLADVVDQLAPLFNATAEALSGVMDGMGEFVNSPAFGSMLDFFGSFGVDMLVSFIDILGNLMMTFYNMTVALEPFIRTMMDGLEGVTQGWQDWSSNLENNQAFQDFVDNALEYGPMVLDMLGSLIQAFMNIGRALEPFAGPMLTAFTFFFDLIANAPVEVLTLMIGAFAGLWLGASILAPLLIAVAGGLGAIATVLGIGMLPLLLWIGAIAGLIAVIVHLWNTNEGFRQNIMDTWNAIKDTVMPIVNDVVQVIRDNWGPIREFVMSVFRSIKNIVIDVMATVGSVIRGAMAIITNIWRGAGQNIMGVVRGMFQVVGGIFRGGLQVISGIVRVIRGVVTGDFNMVREGVTRIVRGLVTAVSGILRGAISILGNIGTAIGRSIYEGVTGIFSRILDRAAALGTGIGNALRDGINYIIRAWNNLSFGIPAFNPPGPGSFPGVQVSTPNVPELAAGGVIDQATLAWVGEGNESEIVAPDSKMMAMADRAAAGSRIDYAALAQAVAYALARVLSSERGAAGGGISREDLQALMEWAGPTIQVDARPEDGNAVGRLMEALGFEMRRLGYGGLSG